jgi:sugar phosphate isomerase/epimerase
VPVEDCVRALTEIGYTDPISIEHEPYSYDPASEIVVFREMLASWLGEPAG